MTFLKYIIELHSENLFISSPTVFILFTTNPITMQAEKENHDDEDKLVSVLENLLMLSIRFSTSIQILLIHTQGIEKT